jgi:hypothetical protein
MTIKYGLQFFFLELTDNDGQNFLAGIVQGISRVIMSPAELKMQPTIQFQSEFQISYCFKIKS